MFSWVGLVSLCDALRKPLLQLERDTDIERADEALHLEHIHWDWDLTGVCVDNAVHILFAAPILLIF